MRKARNHRPIRKRKPRCYGDKGKKCKTKKKNETHARVSQSIERCRESIEKKPTSMDQEAIELEERRFFKKGKTHRDECNKQATQTNIQAIY